MAKREINVKAIQEFTEEELWVLTHVMLENASEFPLAIRKSMFALRRGEELNKKQSESLHEEIRFYANWLQTSQGSDSIGQTA